MSGLEREKERAKPRKAAARSENKENEKAAPKKPAASTRAPDHTAGHGKVCAQREVRDDRDAEQRERQGAPAQTAQKRRVAADQPGPAGKRAKSNGISGASTGSDGSREAAAASGEGTTAAARKARAKSVGATVRTKETREAPHMHPRSGVAEQQHEAPEGPESGEQQGRARKPAARAAHGQSQEQEGGTAAVGEPDAAARRCSSDQGPQKNAPAGADRQEFQAEEEQARRSESPTAFQKLKDRYHDLCQRYRELKNVTMEEVDNVLRRHGEVVAQQSESAQKLARMWKEEAARQQQLLQQALASKEHEQLQRLQDEKDALERSLLEKEAENLRLQRELAMAARRVSILSRGRPEMASVEVQVTPPSVLLEEQSCQYPSPQPAAGFATPSTVRRRRQVTGLPHALVPEGVMQGEVPSQIHSGLAPRPRQPVPAAAAASPAPEATPPSPGGPHRTSMQPPLGRSPLSEGSPRGQLQLQSADAATASPQPDPASSAAASCPRPAAETPAPPAGTRNVALSPLLPAAALQHSLPATLQQQHPQRSGPNLDSGREDGQKAVQQQQEPQASPIEHAAAMTAAPTASEAGRPLACRAEVVLRQRLQRSCMQPVQLQNASCLQAAVQPPASAAPPASSACAGIPGGPVEPPAEASAALEQHHAASCEAGSWLLQQQSKLEELEQLYSQQKHRGGAGCEASGRPANPAAIAETEAQGQSGAVPAAAAVGEMQEGEGCPPAQSHVQVYAAEPAARQAEGAQRSSKKESAGMDGAPVSTLEVHAPADGRGGDGCANDDAVPAATRPQRLGHEPESQLQHEQLAPGPAAAEGRRPTGASQHPLSYLSTLSAEEQEDGSMRCVHGPTGFAFVLRRSAPSRSVSGFDGLLGGSCQDRALTELLNYAPLTDDADALQLPPHFQEPIEFPATAAMRSKFMQQLLAALDTASSRLRPQPPVAA